MNAFNWDHLSDYWFVQLAADLLREMGFQDVLVQGDGPDGGLDLIVTEPLRFAIQGVQPFRWGVQCKFSKRGSRRSVTDREIRDVEGILRSDRYVALGLNGYMVITNRRVSQNVVERLRGIGRQSPFRTAILDGGQIEMHLRDLPTLYARYFGEAGKSVISLGSPIMEALPDEKNRFLIDVAVSDPNDPLRRVELSALIDPAAQISSIPSTVIDSLQPLDTTYVAVRYLTGEARSALAVMVDFRVGTLQFQNIMVLAIDRPEAILG